MLPLHCHIDFKDLNIAFSEIAETMGYKNGDVPPPVDSLIDRLLNETPDYCRIEGGLIIVQKVYFDLSNKSVHANEVEFKVKHKIYNELKESEKIALFVCTAGPEISDYSKRLMQQGDMLDGYVLDVIGSAVVEKAMDKVQEQFGKKMEEAGYKITNRFSPGYCGWQTAEQHKLFSFFPDNFCNVKLTDSALMHPIKSISGIIGIGKNVRYKEYNCDMCDAVNCIYRKKAGNR